MNKGIPMSTHMVPRRCRLPRIGALALFTFLSSYLSEPAFARVVALDVLSVEPAFAGRVFKVGTYDRVLARARYAVDPADARNAGIVDLAKAPRNTRGEVEFSADVEILRPRNNELGNRRLLYDVLNRGSKLGLSLLNDAPYSNGVSKSEEAGNGHVFDQGYTVVWSAWQPDVGPGNSRLLVQVPVISGSTGLSREEVVFDNTNNPAILDLSFPVATIDPAQAKLTVRNNESDPRSTPPGLHFRYLSPTRIEISRPEGAHLGAIYEFIYPAKDNMVSGLGFAAVRDLISFLRHGGLPGDKPAAGQKILHVYGFGFSQSGRFLRSFVQEGFNTDEQGRQVFDGVIPHAAGSRGVYLNASFAQPGRYSREHEDHLYPGDQFPFAWGVSKDPVSGLRDGLLRDERNQPKVIQTDTALEVWQGRSSLLNTDGDGKRLSVPENVRLFLLAGLPHFPVIGQKSAVSPVCKYPTNTVFPGAPLRALLRDLDEWVSQGRIPPMSRFPGMELGQWLAPEQVPVALAKVPGFIWSGVNNRLTKVDYSRLPPREGKPYKVFVPRVDVSGHEIDAIRLPVIEVPRATYLGWNTRRYGFGEPHVCGLVGSRLPLAATRAEREKSGDTRLSLEERYPSQESYVAQVKQSAERLVAERLLLPEDAEKFVRQAVDTGSLD
jgi:Alpha/beta hydrolase domain